MVVTTSVGAGLGIGSTLMSVGALSGVVVPGTVVRGGRDVVGGRVVAVVVDDRSGATATGAGRSAEHAASVATATSTAAARRRLQTTHP